MRAALDRVPSPRYVSGPDTNAAREPSAIILKTVIDRWQSQSAPVKQAIGLLIQAFPSRIDASIESEALSVAAPTIVPNNAALA